MTVPTWLIPVLMWAPMKAEKAKEVPGIYKVILPVLLAAVILTVIAITIFSIINLLKKDHKLDDPTNTDPSPLASGEMTKYESQARIAPGLGKILAIVFILGLVAFMFSGFYTMGRSAGTTEQLRKEGKEKQQRLKDRKAAAASTGDGLQVGDDGDSGMKGGEFGGGLDGMK